MEPKNPNAGRLMNRYPIEVVKLHPEAEQPNKESPKDVGWILTVVGRDNNRIEDVQGDANLFTTGLQLKAPAHYHLEILEHPSLYKAGYSLAGSPRVIDPDNDEEVLLPLIKFKECDDLQLPFPAAIAVLRVTEYATVSAVQSRRSAQTADYEDMMKTALEMAARQMKPSKGGRSSSSIERSSTSETRSSSKKNGHGSKSNHMM